MQSYAEIALAKSYVLMVKTLIYFATAKMCRGFFLLFFAGLLMHVSSFYIGESSLNPMKVGTNEPTYQSKHSDDLKLKWKEKIGRLSGIFEKKFQNPKQLNRDDKTSRPSNKTVWEKPIRRKRGMIRYRNLEVEEAGNEDSVVPEVDQNVEVAQDKDVIEESGEPEQHSESDQDRSDDQKDEETSGGISVDKDSEDDGEQGMKESEESEGVTNLEKDKVDEDTQPDAKPEAETVGDNGEKIEEEQKVESEKDEESKEEDVESEKDKEETDADIKPEKEKEKPETEIKPEKGKEETDADIKPEKEKEKPDADIKPEKEKEKPETEIKPENEKEKPETEIKPEKEKEKPETDIKPEKEKEKPETDIKPEKEKEKPETDIKPEKEKEKPETDIKPEKEEEDDKKEEEAIYKLELEEIIPNREMADFIDDLDEIFSEGGDYILALLLTDLKRRFNRARINKKFDAAVEELSKLDEHDSDKAMKLMEQRIHELFGKSYEIRIVRYLKKLRDNLNLRFDN